jgi:tetratricopeptide (TPR) repeat protein
VEADDIATVRKGTRQMATHGLLPGTRVGRYTVLERVGQGGMSTVHAALDNELGRRVALKLMRIGSRAGSQTLLHEGQAMARLNHPNVVTVFEVGRHAGQLYLAIEYVPGRTLRRWLADEKPSPDRVLHAFVELGRGLAAAHDAALVHRDFKPENVLVDARETFKVADFGVARLLDLPSDPEASGTYARGSSSISGLEGTPPYMAPEQHRGEPGDAAADQYAYCVALYEALVGRRPFSGSSHEQLEEQKSQRLRRPRSIPTRVWRVVRRGLEPDPQQRWPSMGALVHALQRASRPRAPAWLLLAGGAIGIAVWALLPSTSTEPCRAADKLAGVWDPSRTTELASVFGASEAPYADEAWTRVQPALDAWATDWSAEYEAVCVAAREAAAGIVDVRMACLGGLRTELLAVVDTLSEGAVERAVDLVSRLPAIERCGEDVLLGGPPRPEPEVAAAVHALEAEIARHRAQRTAGATLVEQSQHDLLRARRIDYAPLLARALVEHASMLEAAGDREAAASVHRECYFLARELGMDDIALQNATQLAAITGYDLGRFEEAGVWAGHARAAVERSGRADEAAHLDAVLGANADARGEYEAALEHYRRGLDALARYEGDAKEQHARLLNNMGAALSGLGRFEEALEVWMRAAEIDRDRLGEHHPDRAVALGNVAGALMNLGRNDEARQVLGEAIAIAEAARGPDHPGVASLRTELGNVELRAGDAERAAVQYERAIRILEGAGSGNTRVLARLYNNLGAAHYERGELEGAARAFELAVEAKRKIGGPRHPSVAGSLTNLGRVRLDRGDPAGAVPLLEEAVAIREGAGVAQHPDAIDTLTTLGRALLAIDRRDEAREALRAAKAIAGAHKGLDPELARELEQAVVESAD